ncbi:MAG: hypothetical protein IJ837_04160 [Clostridia bacterium]|nr:hypothetical protein [Clostridia bacterium]
MEQSSLCDLIKNGFKNLVPQFDTNNVVGDEITLEDGTKVLPLIKISVGYVSGGGEYAKTHNKSYPFAGGTSSGCVAEPIGFFVVSKLEQKFIPLNSENIYKKSIKKLLDAVCYVLKNDSKAKLKKVKEEVKNAKK